MQNSEDVPECPICRHQFKGGLTGWHAHIGAFYKHPKWHPEARDPNIRKKLFIEEFPHFFDGHSGGASQRLEQVLRSIRSPTSARTASRGVQGAASDAGPVSTRQPSAGASGVSAANGAGGTPSVIPQGCPRFCPSCGESLEQYFKPPS